MIDAIAKEALVQLLALATFFAFPAIQYVLLKRFSRRKGCPEIWYIPAYKHFRLVMRNIPGKKTLSDIKYRAIVRHVVPAGPGCSVATWPDQVLVEREDFFVFSGSDQILLCFRLERDDGDLVLIHTDKLGEQLTRGPFPDSSLLFVDYSANVENLFNFDVRVAKRVEVTAVDLSRLLSDTKKNDEEQMFAPTRVRDVR